MEEDIAILTLEQRIFSMNEKIEDEQRRLRDKHQVENAAKSHLAKLTREREQVQSQLADLQGEVQRLHEAVRILKSSTSG
jgi:cell division protein FtsL